MQTYTVTFVAKGYPWNSYTFPAESKGAAILQATRWVRAEEPRIAYRLKSVTMKAAA